jgi:6-phosphofructokinase 2
LTRPVVTLTLNPAIDAACVADEVVPMRKVRTRDERYDPGGGGLNVARVIRELGGEAVAFYLAGGITGQALEGLVERGGIAAVRVPIQDLTRVSHTVFETSTGQEFRFTPEGPLVT